MTDANIVEIFFYADEFSRAYDRILEQHSLAGGAKPKRKRRPKMSDAEVMAILILFHHSRMRDLKAFYRQRVCQQYANLFPVPLSYSRFVERQGLVALKLNAFLNLCCLGKCTGISIIDSTPLPSCHIRRWRRHRVMRGIAQTGYGTMGRFHGLKLHLAINDRGEVIAYQITPGNTDDRAPLQDDRFVERLFGKLVGDKGYISKDLFSRLFHSDIQLITKIRKNMRNALLPRVDKRLLRKRCIIETVNDMLKNVCHIDHTRHRNPRNFFSNLSAGLIAYNFYPKKPSMNLDIIDCQDLALFQ